MGRDSGLKYMFTDTTVENGQTYYYAVCSYDQGYDLDFFERGIVEIPDLLPISPAECTKRVDVDPTGNIIETDINTVIVTPNAPASGYTAPKLVKLEQIAGLGNGTIEVYVIDPMAIPAPLEYELRFHGDSQIQYDLFAYPENEPIFINSPYLAGEDQNDTFNGIRLMVYSKAKLEIDVDSLRWKTGDSNYWVKIEMGKQYREYAMPADYEIEFGETGVDTSVSTGHLLPFKIKNVSSGEYIKVRAAAPRDRDYWDYGDDIYFYEYVPELDKFKFTWIIDILPPDTTAGVVPIEPQPGDVYSFKTARPFTADDIFRFQVAPATIDHSKLESALDEIAVVPNPYVVSASWEKQHNFNSGRGEQKIDFIHLPLKCTIKIFTLRGYLVRELEHNSSLLDGTESWNLITKDGMSLAYGVYIYHVEVPGVGTKIDKFVVIQ